MTFLQNLIKEYYAVLIAGIVGVVTYIGNKWVNNDKRNELSKKEIEKINLEIKRINGWIDEHNKYTEEARLANDNLSGMIEVILVNDIRKEYQRLLRKKSITMAELENTEIMYSQYKKIKRKDDSFIDTLYEKIKDKADVEDEDYENNL